MSLEWKITFCSALATKIAVTWVVLYWMTCWTEPGRRFRFWAGDAHTRSGILLRGLITLHVVAAWSGSIDYAYPYRVAWHFWLGFGCSAALFGSSLLYFFKRSELAIIGFVFGVLGMLFAWGSTITVTR
jgi:hypothetical protein